MPGQACAFGAANHTCMVVSNHYGNRAVVLHARDDDWGGAYIILSYCNQKAWQPWPTLVMGIIDNPLDGRVTRGYELTKRELEARPVRADASVPTPPAIHTTMMQFDELARDYKHQWFKEHTACLGVSDWRFEAFRIKRSAAIIQSHWRKCIGSPCYTLCIRRLMREYHTLSFSPVTG